MSDAALAAPGTSPLSGTVDAVVVGGGVAGLVAAHQLLADGLSPVVLEGSAQCGGYLARGDVGPAGAPVLVDVGAESFAARSTAVSGLVAALGLTAVEPSGLSAWGYVPVGTDTTGTAQGRASARPGARGTASPVRPGRAFPLPKTGVLGIPGHPFAADTRRAVGLLGALRASLDRVLPASRVDTSTLASFVRSRLGSRVLDRLVTPVAGGVHSTDPALLSVDAVAPGLRAAYERTGSLTAAVRSLRAQAPAGSAVHGLPGGMNQLVAALERAVEAGGTVRRSTAVEGLRHEDGLWTVRTSAGDLRTPRVVVAVSGHAAVGLLDGVVDVRGAAPARGTDIRLVTLLLDAPALDSAPRGTGILAAPGTAVVAKASTHASAKWPWLRERLDATLGPHAHVVRLSYGRGGAAQASTAEARAGQAARTTTSVQRSAPAPAPAPAHDPAQDAALVAQAVADVSALYGVPLEPAQVVSSDVTRWDDALAPPTPEHRARTAALLTDVAALGAAGMPGLTVTGAWVAGTGLAAVVPHAQQAARSLSIS